MTSLHNVFPEWHKLKLHTEWQATQQILICLHQAEKSYPNFHNVMLQLVQKVIYHTHCVLNTFLVTGKQE